MIVEILMRRISQLLESGESFRIDLVVHVHMRYNVNGLFKEV